MSTICIPGRLTKDAELKHGNNGSFATFSVAETIRTKDGEKPQFFDCTLNGKRAEALVKYLTKGSSVTVVGSLTTREYNGKTYLQVSASEITLQGSKKDGGGSSERYGSSGAGSSAKHTAPSEENDDPFGAIGPDVDF